MIEPLLALADPGYLDRVRCDLDEWGIVDAVAARDTPSIYNWLVAQTQYQGLSDRSVDTYALRNGIIGWSDVEERLAGNPTCSKLRSYWHFSKCGYRKTGFTCSESSHIASCPLPAHRIRNGRLSQNAYSLFLFMRDICDGDFVGWIDERLRDADRDEGVERGMALARAILEPMSNIHGVSYKVLSMAMADLLLGADPGRERWVAAGASMIAIDTLVHNFLHRTGILRRFGAAHRYGPACYAEKGCASIIRELAGRIDARIINPQFPASFRRFVQHAVWAFCAQTQLDICNGNQIDDRMPCQNAFCPAFKLCDRVPIRRANLPGRR